MKIWRARERGELRLAKTLEDALKSKLETVKIVKVIQNAQSATGLSLVQLEDGTLAMFKLLPTELGKELAAFRLDSLLKSDRVPVSVARTLPDGRKGLVQIFVPGKSSRETIFHPPEARRTDFLMNYDDRHNANYMVVEGRLVLIDHEFSFQRELHRSTPKFPAIVADLVSRLRTANATEKGRILSELQVTVGTEESFNRIVKTKPSKWLEELGPYLSIDEGAALLERRAAVIEAVKAARREIGDAVFAGPNSGTPWFQWSGYGDRIEKISRKVKSRAMRAKLERADSLISEELGGNFMTQEEREFVIETIRAAEQSP